MNPQIVEQLTQLLGERFTTSEYERQQHGKDESSLKPMPPDGVCFPLTTAEVSAVVKICYQHKMPVIPFGAGSSLEGHVFASHGGITIDMSRMNKILMVSADDLDCTVQAGLSRQDLDQHRPGLVSGVCRQCSTLAADNSALDMLDDGAGHIDA